MITAERICQEAKNLPPDILPTVMEFMHFLRKRSTAYQGLDLVMAQESSLNLLWDNDEDEVWNEVPSR
jgi:hypothetical protein